MPIKSKDLHGSVPDTAEAALLLIDVINDFDFGNGEQLLQLAMPASQQIADLKRRARANRIPTIYANDNFGKWQSDFKKIVNHCLGDNVLGKPFVERLLPGEDDYFVLKPKHSGFFLHHLGASA